MLGSPPFGTVAKIARAMNWNKRRKKLYVIFETNRCVESKYFNLMKFFIIRIK